MKCFVCGNELPEVIIGKLGTPIDELGLQSRAKNCLRHAGIEYVEQLIKLEYNEVLLLRNMGTKTAQEVKDKVNAFGFDWC